MCERWIALILVAALLGFAPGCGDAPDRWRADGPARVDPALAALEARLRAVLIDGRLPDGAKPADAVAACRDRRRGVVADYRAYTAANREYVRRLARKQVYSDLPLVRALYDDPIAAPATADRFAAAIGGAASAFDQVAFLLGEFPGATVPARTAGPAEADPDAFARLRREVIAAADVLETDALGAVTERQRRYLRFVVPWLCRTNARFINRSKDAPPYALQWTFYPEDPFRPNAATTEQGKIPVPEGLVSMTGVYHLLRALAAEPVTTDGLWGGAEAWAKSKKDDKKDDKKEDGKKDREDDKDTGKDSDKGEAGSEPKGASAEEQNAAKAEDAAGTDEATETAESSPAEDGTEATAAPTVVPPIAHPSFAGEVDYAAMGRAWAMLQAALAPDRLDAVRDALAGRPPVRIAVDGVAGDLLAVEETPFGRILVGGTGANSYTDVDALLILDLGGNDTYRTSDAHGIDRIGRRALQLIVDEAGDDIYVAEGVGGPAGGILGISVLVDRGGNDRYCQGLAESFRPRDATFASLVRPDPEGEETDWIPYVALYGNPDAPDEPGVLLDAGLAFGAGFLGIGCLVDAGGDDLYLGQKWCFGAGFWRGVGVLRDAGGRDAYATGTAALGAGVNAAFGVLDDRAGADHYQCLGHHENGYSIGKDWDNGYACSGLGYGASWRAEDRGGERWYATAGGGVGLLRDGGGDDMYIGSAFGVAAGYAGGAGLLVDDAGNDTYFVKLGPGGANRSSWSGNHALGNGCHRGVGVLLDRTGRDRYSGSMLGGGSAWDVASGYLLDLGGDDALVNLHGTKFRGHTGWAGAKAFAVSYHYGGSDVYERKELGTAAAIQDAYPGVGGNFAFFFDVGGGDDTYLKNRKRNHGNGLADVSAVAWEEVAGGKDPQGIGLFLDDGPVGAPADADNKSKQ